MWPANTVGGNLLYSICCLPWYTNSSKSLKEKLLCYFFMTEITREVPEHPFCTQQRLECTGQALHWLVHSRSLETTTSRRGRSGHAHSLDWIRELTRSLRGRFVHRPAKSEPFPLCPWCVIPRLCWTPRSEGPLCCWTWLLQVSSVCRRESPSSYLLLGPRSAL